MTSGINFGATAAAPKIGTVQPFSFGTQTQQPASTTSSSILGLNLSIPKTTAGATGFGLPKTTAPTLGTFSFGAPVVGTTTTTSGFSFGATGFGATAAPATTTSAAPSLFGPGAFGSTAASTSQAVAPFSFSQPALGTVPPGSTTSIAAAASRGLGGVNFSTSGAAAGGTGQLTHSNTNTSGGTLSSVSGESKHGKDIVLPAEVVSTVEAFKKSLAEQKQIREALMKYSDAPLARARDELAVVRAGASELSSGLQRRIAHTKTLRQELTRHERNVSMLRRTADMVPGVDMCGATAGSMQYFTEVLADAEARLFIYKQEVENLEALLSGVELDGSVLEGTALSQMAGDGPKDLVTLLRRVHEGFVAMAAQLQYVHEEAESCRTEYLARRRQIGDTTASDLLLPSRRRRSPHKQQMNNTSSRVTSAYGPSPFESPGHTLSGVDTLHSYHTYPLHSTTAAPVPSQSLGFSSTLGFRGTTTGPTGLSGVGAASNTSGFGFGSTFSSPAGGTLFGGTATSSGTVFGKTGSVARPPSAPGSTFGPDSSSLFGGFGSTTAGTGLLAGASGFQLQNPPLGKKKR